MAKGLRDQIKATNLRIERWNERARLFNIVREMNCFTPGAVDRRAKWLQYERNVLVRRLDEESAQREEMATRSKQSRARIRRQLQKLLYEIDEDLSAGRLTPDQHDSAKHRFNRSLVALDAPMKPGQRVRIVGIPHKTIDTDKLAQVFWMMAEREVRERKGHPPLTEEEQRAQRALAVQVTADVRREKYEQQLLKQRQAEAAYKRFVSRKPRQLRQATWDWLIQKDVRELPPDGRLGRLFFEMGGTLKPELTQGTIIQLANSTDYVIDRRAAEGLATRQDPIELVRLSDRQGSKTPLARIIAAIVEGFVFDQLEI